MTILNIKITIVQLFSLQRAVLYVFTFCIHGGCENTLNICAVIMMYGKVYSI